ncbi:MAG: diacylglycerol kinase family protein [Lachnospiraceae bacterium]|nr:diacylglycerol kinase family protein [Lachnospiraceae bacterium]
MVYVLYNPLAGNRTCEESCKGVGEIFGSEDIRYIDLLTIEDIDAYIKTLSADDQIVICGGDGTLNRLINSLDAEKLEQDVFYYRGGSGNDFFRDIDVEGTDSVIRINKYMKCLPEVTVAGQKKFFINGIGYGIDGYCCEEGDKERVRAPGKKVNYALIALKGVLYGFSTVNAKVTVDGVTREYSNVWMAPTMNGRYYGGGMMCAPGQDRLNEDGLVSVLVVHARFRIQLLFAFLSVFKGNHLKYKSLVTRIMGSNVRVEFDKPTALQIDGETVSDVLWYEVKKEKKIIC